MPLVDVDLGPEDQGLFLDVVVAASTVDRERPGYTPKDPIQGFYRNYRAQVDTGATGTCITSKVVLDLKLPDYGPVEMGTAGGIAQTRRRAVALFLFGATEHEIRVLDNLSVLEFADLGDDVDILIGMDVLNECVLHWHGKRRSFYLAFNQE